jgi:hypothetical protein
LLPFSFAMTKLTDVYASKGEPALGTFRTLEKKYGRLISEARKEWERRFAGSDPGDACVTVRINGVDSRTFGRLFPLEYSRRLESFASN